MDDATHQQLSDLCAAGDLAADQGRYGEALASYGEAWHLIPEPKQDWNASTWVLAAIGDACFLTGDFAESRKALEFAMHCPEAIGNPFLHLRLGQALLEQGEEDRAADELIRVYMGAGKEIFDADDPKYLAFLSTRAKLDS
jgi:tetratricopeptide (TPR) repeat protein